MRIGLLLFIFCLFTLPGFSQNKPVEGIVFSKATKERIAKVNVRNLRNGQSVYNTLKADFKINAQPGDLLVFSKLGYYSDTIKVQNGNDLAVYLRQSSIMLKDVNIRDTLMNPQRKLALTRKEYSKAYGSDSYRDILSLGPGGAGISIDALWNMLSRRGRNAEHLQQIIARDHQQDIIDYRFNKTFVQQITGLQDPQLTNFMARYRPSYYLVTTANDYDFINTIKANLKRFQRYPDLVTMPPLKAQTQQTP
ncbi:hypothetical protein KHS38_14365 [Mucilaginibacter sp. Bleaf8]|uniref:hypothetical protein n=1 Tax=Mucilaginibacter sp. Bleaf8 TaxID=2834430 RepID=UPI001BCAADE5|nr:hypothetical protein [Mucilaginibacter sp. Bleaf8]MBS7565593.1 hypothetical protein [Mucilaginibacter sp. Bleaf8]